MARPIEGYALIGDLHTAALVGDDGSIDWLCLPRFDSPACFAALLGDESNGRWLIAPREPVREVRRRYRDSTLVLETEFVTDSGVVRVVDAMPPRDGQVDLLRQVIGVEGTVPMQLRWVLRFSYGSAAPWVRRITDAQGRETIHAVAGPDAVCLRGDLLPTGGDGVHTAEFDVSAGETTSFHLVWYSSVEEPPEMLDPAQSLADTQAWWQDWMGRCEYTGAYREAVVRSLVTLKALIYHPTGGIVAAPTTSLPEAFGGSRNWDYRYCWLRDATLTLLSFLESGFETEAGRWRDWLLRAVAGDPADLQIAYGVAGERQLPELELPWLAGYEGASPVRIGNGAAAQFQLDVYGEVLHAMAAGRHAGLVEDDFSWPVQRAILDYLEENWNTPDRSLWEVRGPARHFTHSKVMVWVAFDRAVEAVEHFGLDGPVERWRELRDEIRAQILDKGWNAEIGSFTQYYGGTGVDAALLMLPLVGFLPADDERMVSTVARIRDELADGDLLSRYHTPAGQGSVDGLSGTEGSFLACSFWLVENLAMAGQLDEATAMFERLLALRNDVGLLAEEYDASAGRQAGNYPQAFSHLALINAAQTLAHGGAEHAARPR